MSDDVAGLMRRLRAAMAGLSVTAEAPAGFSSQLLQAERLGTTVQAPKTKKEMSQAPRADVEPPPFDLYRERFAKWLRRRTANPRHDRDLVGLRSIVGEAELALRLIKGQHRRLGLVEEYSADRDQRIAEEYEGMHYADAAAMERCSPTALRRARELKGREPRYGRKRTQG